MNFFVFNVFIFYILFFSAFEVKSERGRGNCELMTMRNRSIYGFEWHGGVLMEPVKDYEDKFTTISQFYYENIKKITKPGLNDLSNYFFPYLDVNVISIKTHNYFPQYEEKETSTDQRLTVEFLCENDELSEITLTFPIEDTNNHQPEFLNGPYEFIVPMPIPHGYYLDLSSKIVARDIDLTNKYIMFSLDRSIKSADAFIVSSPGPDSKNKKNYPATFFVSTDLNLEEDVTYTLYATDSGNPPRTTNTSMKIIIDKANSFPRFKRSFYTSNFTSFSESYIEQTMNNGMLLSLLEENIILDRGYKNIEKVEIKDVLYANKEDFQLTQVESADGIAIYVEWLNFTKETFQKNVITLTLVATTDRAEAVTIVQILLPGSSNDDEVPCVKHAINVQKFVEEVSSGGYIAATVILSLISMGLSGYIVYFFFYM